MDDQSVHPCEPVNQSFDNDSTETDESKEESKDDDAKESLTGKKAIIILELNRLPVCCSFSKDFSVWNKLCIFIFNKAFQKLKLSSSWILK